MDRIIKAVIFDGLARVSVIDSTNAINTAIKLHNLTPHSAMALGRVLTLGAYIGNNLKDESSKFSITINGDGPIGKIVVAGESDSTIRGFVYNPSLVVNVVNDFTSMANIVGKNGDITVIKDLGLKKPYIGRCELVSGEIGDDFANYLLKSEGIANTVVVGVAVDATGAKASGGIIIEALPGATEDMLYMLEDITSNFSNFSTLLAEKSAEDIMNFYFGHLKATIFPTEYVEYQCKCSTRRIDRMVTGLGAKEAYAILEEIGKLEVGCEFCSKKYTYSKEDLDLLFK